MNSPATNMITTATAPIVNAACNNPINTSIAKSFFSFCSPVTSGYGCSIGRRDRGLLRKSVRSTTRWYARGTSARLLGYRHGATEGTGEGEPGFGRVNSHQLTVVDLTCQQLARQRVENLLLDHAFERARAIGGVVA